MESLIKSGKYIFILPLTIFGVMHFLSVDEMKANVPGGAFSVYLTGLALLLVGVAVFIGKYDRLACILLGVMLLCFNIAHFDFSNESLAASNTIAIMKNVSLAGAAFMAAGLAKDKSVL
jgi:putative oxidoreductase